MLFVLPQVSIRVLPSSDVSGLKLLVEQVCKQHAVDSIVSSCICVQLDQFHYALSSNLFLLLGGNNKNKLELPSSLYISLRLALFMG